jgi:hypothetical protein
VFLDIYLKRPAILGISFLVSTQFFISWNYHCHSRSPQNSLYRSIPSLVFDSLNFQQQIHQVISNKRSGKNLRSSSSKTNHALNPPNTTKEINPNPHPTPNHHPNASLRRRQHVTVSPPNRRRNPLPRSRR